MQTDGVVLVLGVALFALVALIAGPGLVLKARARRAGFPNSPPLIGPLFWVELLRLGRGGTQLRLRTVYSLILLVGLLVAYLREIPDVSPLTLILGGEVPPEGTSKLGETFFFIFLLFQLLMLTLVTPVFAGASLFEERDRRTFELLRSSMLSDREIVTGKLAARVLFVLSLTLTGLPILAIAMLLGGIDGERLVCAFVVSIFYTISLATLSFQRATTTDTVGAAFAQALGLHFQLAIAGMFFSSSLPIMSGLSPFVWEAKVFGLLGRGTPPVVESTLVSILIHTLLSIYFGVHAIGRLQTMALPHLAGNPASERVRTFFPIPPVSDDDPLLWKEQSFSLQARWNPAFTAGCLMTLVTIGVPLVLVGLLNQALWSENLGEPLSLIFRGVCVPLIGFAIPFVGLVLSCSLARERQQQTLESLFMLPTGRRELLLAKWRSAVAFLTPVRYTAIASVATALLSLALHPIAVGVTALLLVATVAFFLSLGIWLSVRCRTVVRSSVWFVGIGMAVFGLPVLAAVPAAVTAVSFGWSREIVEVFVASFSPPFAVGYIPMNWQVSNSVGEWRLYCVAAVATGAIYLFTAVFLWRDAVRKFEREGR